MTLHLHPSPIHLHPSPLQQSLKMESTQEKALRPTVAIMPTLLPSLPSFLPPSPLSPHTKSRPTSPLPWCCTTTRWTSTETPTCTTSPVSRQPRCRCQFPTKCQWSVELSQSVSQVNFHSHVSVFCSLLCCICLLFSCRLRRERCPRLNITSTVSWSVESFPPCPPPLPPVWCR